MAIETITSLTQFESLLHETPYLVADFYADWCPPCKAIAPVYQNLATQHADKSKLVKFVKVNVDSVGDVAAKYGVTAMPTFMFFEKGKVYGGRSMIRGADARALQGVVLEIVGKAEREEKEKEEKKGEEETVSGGYELTAESGKRADWKMSLNA